MLRPSNPEGMRTAWAALEDGWSIDTAFEEEFWHQRYAQRDLAQLEAAD